MLALPFESGARWRRVDFFAGGHTRKRDQRVWKIRRRCRRITRRYLRTESERNIIARLVILPKVEIYCIRRVSKFRENRRSGRRRLSFLTLFVRPIDCDCVRIPTRRVRTHFFTLPARQQRRSARGSRVSTGDQYSCCRRSRAQPQVQGEC